MMSITTITSRDFNQDTSSAKKAALAGPVIITDRGRPAHVLLTIEEYRKLTEPDQSIVDLLRQCEAGEFEFMPERLNIRSRNADLE